jgi:hypothetical protein
MSQTRPRAYEISSVYIALAIKRAIERAKGGGDGGLKIARRPPTYVVTRDGRFIR